MSVSLSIQLITVSLISLQRQYSHDLTVSRNTWSDSYDYIVVGAGTAGAVVAHRLAENQINKVILLEAGGAQNIISDTPGLQIYGINSLWDWNYTTVPQVNYDWAQNSVVKMNRGKIIGGTSSINGMFYNRGNKRGYNNWVNTYGAQGWSYAEVLPYFIKFENNTDLNIVKENPGYHGTRGLVVISSDPNPQPIFKLDLKAFNELGLKTIDINGAKQLGAAIGQSFIGNGIRSSSGNAYIDPNPFPKNLHILTKAQVIRVLMKQTNEGLKAFGVHFIRDNKLYEVKANKEVILSAGAFGSPQILMLSGIGPKDHLKRLGIKVLLDLPVGNNLQDHPAISFEIVIMKEGVKYNSIPDESVQQLYQLFTQRSGPLSRNTQLGAYLNSASNRDKQWPNCLMQIAFNGPLSADSIQETYINQTEGWIKYFNSYLGKITIGVRVKLVRVKSRGTVRLASNNPLDYPLIDPKYLSNSQDFEDSVDLVKRVYSFLTNTSFANYVYVIQTPIPGCEHNVCTNQPLYECDPYIRCFIRTMGQSDWHPVGTCRMGAVTRDDVVVDPTLRVKGVLGLRVCDASVMPVIPNANTNAASIMIGEKCSDLIIK